MSVSSANRDFVFKSGQPIRQISLLFFGVFWKHSSIQKWDKTGLLYFLKLFNLKINQIKDEMGCVK